MAKSQDLANFENMVEKIIFDDNELENLKIAIKNFTEGKTTAKELKGLLLQCRGRMVEDITDFAFFFAEKRTKNLLQAEKDKEQLPSTTKVESQLREEIREKNELLEMVAQRVNKLVSKFSNKYLSEDQKPVSIEEVKEEIERCLNQIGAKEWIEMSYYNDYKFFVKLYPKLEELYKERFGESKKTSNNTNDGKGIMANKMVEFGFPKDIETILVQYISIRNIFHHSMEDISPSNLELAREVFVNVFVYLTINSIETKFLVKNRELVYANLTKIFSKRLIGNPAFRREILERFKTVLYA